MANLIARFFDGYKLSVGRRILVLRAILAVAAEVDDEMIKERTKKAIEKEYDTWSIVDGWKRSRSQREGTRPEAKALDHMADRALTGCYDAAQNFVRNLPESAPLHQDGKAFIARFFPDGSGAVTTQRYEDQLATMERYVEQWKGAWRVRVDRMHIGLFVDNLAELLPRYKKALVSPNRREVTYDQVKSAEAAGEDILASILGLILGLYGEDNPESNELRQRYLATYIDQQSRVGEYHKRLRPVPDVDIETGEEAADDSDTPVVTEDDVDLVLDA